MEEKKERTVEIFFDEKEAVEIEGFKPFRSPSPPLPSVFKPFVYGAVAGLLSGCLDGAMNYSVYTLNEARYRKHLNYARYALHMKMMPGMVLIDAFAYAQILGFYNILRGQVVARNDGMRPSLYQEAASGLIAGAAAAFLRFPFDLACQQMSAKSLGPMGERFIIRNTSVLRTLRNGGPWMKMKAGLGMGMVAAYNPSLHYLTESHGFSEKNAKMGAEAISAFSAVAGAQLAQQVSSFSAMRQTLISKGPLGFFAGFSGLFYREVSKVMLFWYSLDSVQQIPNLQLKHNNDLGNEN